VVSPTPKCQPRTSADRTAPRGRLIDGVMPKSMTSLSVSKRPRPREVVTCALVHHKEPTPCVRKNGCHQHIDLRDRERRPTALNLWISELLRERQANHMPIDRQRRSLPLRAS
jgi:hypothetical protein